jgi:NADH:ubiquinone oxidoreductase subunit 2 (subunit N)
MTDSLATGGSPLIVLLMLAGPALGILVAEQWRVHWRVSAWVALAALVVAPALGAIAVLSEQGGTLRGMISLGGPASIRVFLASGAAASVILLDLGGRRQTRSARYALVLLSVCGIVTVAQSRHMIPLVLGIAIVHVALTALTGTRTGGVSYALSVIGLAAVLLATALLYGATGSLGLDQIRGQLAGQALQELRNPLLTLGLALLFAGLGLFLGVVPFHTWIHTSIDKMSPRQGYVIATLAPQLALAALAHLHSAWPAQVTALVLLVSTASIPLGYARALRGSTLAEVLAGLTMGQSGLLAGYAVLAIDGAQPMAYYALGNYLLNAMCLWAVSSQLSQPSKDRPPATFAGVGRRSPQLGAALTVCLLNVAGLYPLAGALTHTGLLQASVAAGHTGGALFAVMGIALGWLVAGKLSLQAWATSDQEKGVPAPSPEVTVVAWGAAAGMLAAGLYATGVWRWIAILAGSS